VSFARLSRLVEMSRCLDESGSFSGFGHRGRLASGVDSINCYLMAMGVYRGSRAGELCVRLFRYSGDSACRSLRKQRNVFWRVVRILPARWGLAHMISVFERK